MTLFDVDWLFAPINLTLYLLFINLTTFLAFALDKYLAKKHMRRVRERTLLALAAFGGTVGAILAQHILGHKTLKQPFKNFLLFIPVIQIAAVITVWLLL